MKAFSIFFVLILTVNQYVLAHDGEGPQIDKQGNIIFHEELTHNISPIMPPRATESGYCCVMLDVTKTGRVENSEVIYCSSPVFLDITRRTAPKITYSPRTVNGIAMPSKDVLEHFSFRLRDRNGKLIKNSDGYPEFNKQGEHLAEHYCHQYLT